MKEFKNCVFIFKMPLSLMGRFRWPLLGVRYSEEKVL